MRTKKILSVLLAMILTASVFSMTGAFAAEVEVAPQAVAQTVWPSPVYIEQNAALAGSVDAAVIEWTVFTNTTTQGTNTQGNPITIINQDGFANYYPEKKASVDWIITDKDDKPVKWYEKGQDAVGKSIQVWNNFTGSKIQLFIKQGTAKYYDILNIQLKVTSLPSAGGGTSPAIETSNQIVVSLKNPKSLNEKLAEVEKKMVSKESRYTDEYYEYLTDEVSACKRALDNVTTTKEDLEALVKKLEKVLKYEEIPAGIEKIFKPTWIPDSLLKIWYAISDFFSSDLFTAIKDVFGWIGSAFGSIGKAFGFIIPLFSTIGGWFGL